MLRNALHKKTNMLIYLRRLLQDIFNKSTADLMWSDVINNVLYWDVSNIFIQRVRDTIFKVFFMDYAERFSC